MQSLENKLKEAEMEASRQLEKALEKAKVAEEQKVAAEVSFEELVRTRDLDESVEMQRLRESMEKELSHAHKEKENAVQQAKDARMELEKMTLNQVTFQEKVSCRRRPAEWITFTFV